MNSFSSFRCLFFFGLFLIGTHLQAEESSFTVPITFNGVVQDKTNNNNLQTWSTADGEDVTTSNRRFSSSPRILVTVTNTNGGPVNGTLTFTPDEGKFIPEGPQSSNISGSGSAFGSYFPPDLVWGWVKNPEDGEGWDISGPDDTNQAISGTVKTIVEYTDSNGGTGDSMDVNYQFTLNVLYDNATNSTGIRTYPTFRVYLYVNGPPPEGRQAPGANVEYDEGTPEFNTNLEGTITNNSDEPQAIEIWAPIGPDGSPVKIGEVFLEPGASIPLDFGFDLPPGTEAMIRTSGETTGGTPYIGEGDNLDLNIEFPPQDKTKIRVISDKEFSDPEPVSIGNESSIQDSWIPPVGVSERDVEVSGDYVIIGGDAVPLGEVDDYFVVMLDVPGGNNRTPTQVGTASVPTSDGGTQQVTIYETPSGQTVTTGNSPHTPSASPPQFSGGNQSGGGLSTSSGNLVDEAANQLAQIRAEMSAANASVGDVGITDLEAENAETTAKVEDVIDNIDEIFDDALTGDEFLFIDPADFEAINAGRTSSVNLVMLGNTYTLDFDHPGVTFLRTLFLFAASWAWFVFLLKFSRF